MTRILYSAALLLMGVACAPVISRTPVHGSASAISRLAGEWSGDYSSTESGRSGAIQFRLRAGADTAEGDVIMTPRQDPNASDVMARSLPTLPYTAVSPAITIRFVAVGGDQVSGELDPYRDPECGCALKTTFSGQVRGNVIEGTFQSQGDGFHHLPANGKWRVTRVTSR